MTAFLDDRVMVKALTLGNHKAWTGAGWNSACCWKHIAYD